MEKGRYLTNPQFNDIRFRMALVVKAAPYRLVLVEGGHRLGWGALDAKRDYRL